LIEPGSVASSRTRRRARRRSDSAVARFFVDAPRWLLLAALVFAPWAYGSTRPWAVQSLSALLATLLVIWITECAAHRRRPEIPLIPVGVSLALLAWGWWMALNAHSRQDTATEELIPLRSWAATLPGSSDGPASMTTMALLTGLVGALWFTCELSRQSPWRKRIWITIAATGFSVAALGVVQKIGGESVLALTWEPDKINIANNFALFRYRANAGAWLNLVLPLLAALAVVTLRKSDHPWRKAFWLVALVMVVGGVQLNPSRASWIIALGLMACVGVRCAGQFWRHHRGTLPRRTLLAYGGIAALITLLLGGLALFGGWQSVWQRMQRQGFDLASRSPTEIYWRMVPDAGWSGFGPGAFAGVFPHYQITHDFAGSDYPEFWVANRWLHAHQDYLQTWIEWGWAGAAAWAVLIGGGMGAGLWKLRRRHSDPSIRWFLFASVLALGGVLVHAWVDFPLQVASIQLYVAVLLGGCWSLPGEEHPDISHRA
jgi:O-antigen ligase